ncbi:hypothetical protein [Chitinivorax sp. B]|uniref:hypothetical protein n=1 Tax=Chitinivorax sp. B TaxID=2502235 RepID=UPI0010F5EB6B|nr:hypothetical protein [Chitinivorax sp. B]
MVAPPHSNKPSTPPVAGKGAWRPSFGYLAIALVLALCGLGYWWMSDSSSSSSETASTTAPKASSTPTSSTGGWPALATAPSSQLATDTQEIRVSRDGDRDPTPDLSNFIPQGQTPTMNEVINRLHQAGIHTGLGAFNPPGTRPPKVGLAVPEGYPLPDGYVRHHQATDDGQRIEPILMFAPDRQILDANNRPIQVPPDRVVTPELAPPGFPIRRIVIPPPIDSGRTGR